MIASGKHAFRRLNGFGRQEYRPYMLALMCLCVCVLVMFSGVRVAYAQDGDETAPPPTLTATPTPTATPIPLPRLQYGGIVSGQIDNRTPREAFRFDGLRGEYLRIQLEATSGNLDPVLAVLDEDGEPVLLRDDSQGTTDALVNQLRLPENGEYMLVVGRFGYALGTTSGSYELSIERIGVSPESGSALRYGDTVANVITDEEPQIFYSFRAQRGDIITLTMRRDSGSLDPLLQVVNASRRILAQNDDFQLTNGQNTSDARIEKLVIEDDGQYLIVATRYSGTGSFLLTLELDDGSGVGGTPQVGIRLRPGDTDEREITDERWRYYYTFNARANDIVTVNMNNAGGTLDPLLEILDANLNPLFVNDDIVDGVNRNSLIEAFRIPDNGTYYIVATRFEMQNGTTQGRYRLAFNVTGNAFAGVSATVRILEYGDTVIGFLDDGNPDLTYSFFGNAGEVVRLAMNRTDGNILPVVTLLNDDQNVIASGSSGSPNALLDEFELPYTGVYYVRATRLNDTGNGGYTMALVKVRDAE